MWGLPWPRTGLSTCRLAASEGAAAGCGPWEALGNAGSVAITPPHDTWLCASSLKEPPTQICRAGCSLASDGGAGEFTDQAAHRQNIGTATGRQGSGCSGGEPIARSQRRSTKAPVTTCWRIAADRLRAIRTGALARRYRHGVGAEVGRLSRVVRRTARGARSSHNPDGFGARGVSRTPVGRRRAAGPISDRHCVRSTMSLSTGNA